jgi:hypothetical protein
VFDIVFLSYDEPRADELYQRISSVSKIPVKRLHGVRGMARAYRLTCELADTDQYFIADADLAVRNAFDFDHVDELPDGTDMAVWKTRNPVTGAIYGYGGLKLCRRDAIRQLEPCVLDVLAGLPGSVRFRAEIAGETCFNQSPFHAWRAGFRECCMLATGEDEYGARRETVQRQLRAWLEPPRVVPFADWAARGARDGIDFGAASERDPAALQQINDPEWLRERFATRPDGAQRGIG